MESEIIGIERKKPGRSASSNSTSDKKKEQNSETDALSRALWTKMSTLHQTTKDLATALDITYPYLMALIRQERKFKDAGRSVLQNAAKYLDVPVAHAYLLAGALHPGDFFFEDKLPSETDSLYNALSTHKMWSGFAPGREEWDSMPEKTRLLICLLFQEAVQRSILTTMNVEIPASPAIEPKVSAQ